MSMRVDQRPQKVREFLDGLPAVDAEPVPPPPDWLPPARSETSPASLPTPRTKAAPPPLPSPAPPRMPRPTWRPPVPYEGPYDIEVTGAELRWPSRCVCCIEASDMALRIEHTTGGGFLGMFKETQGWDVPHC